MATIAISQYNKMLGEYYSTTKLYISKALADSATETGRQPIKIEVGSVTNPWKLSYSLDEGSNWTDIVTGQTGTEYIWIPNDGIDWTAMLNNVTDYDARNILIKVTDDALATAQLSCSLYRASLTTAGISPNHNVTECSSDSDESIQKAYAQHSDPIYIQDAVLIDISESWYSEANYFEVWLEDSASLGTYHKLHNFNLHPKALTMSWIFAATKIINTNNTVESLLNKDNATIRLHVIAMDESNNAFEHSGNYAKSSWFAYTSVLEPEYYANDNANYSSRTDMFTRLGIEKAIYLDEAIPLAQLEAGDGMEVIQRNSEGRLINETGGVADANEPIDYKKAYNVVIQSKITEIPDSPRHLSGWFQITEASTRVEGTDQDDEENWITGTYSMGSPFQYDINHGWNLEGENQGNFRLDVYNVIGDKQFLKPELEMIPMWESVSSNTVRVYVILKDDSQYQPAIKKDDLDAGLDAAGAGYSRWFFFNLTEIIPELPVVTIKSTTVVGSTTIEVSGEVKTIGISPVTDRGFYYKTTTPPAPTGVKVAVGKGKGTFTTVLTGLTPNTSYYIQPYATNSAGTSYGAIIMRTTTA